MKKLFALAAVALILSMSTISCTPENQVNDEQLTDKDKVCPPNDRNCNGIPDDQE